MATEDEIQVVAFRVGPQEFAVDILQVERILRYERHIATGRNAQTADHIDGGCFA